MAVHRTRTTLNSSADAGDTCKTDLLLHPELLSEEFIQLMLRERKIAVGGHEDHQQLAELYQHHVLPLPQRDLPRSRWGRRMEKSRARQSLSISSTSHNSSSDGCRKRPLIPFDGSSTDTGSVKLKKAEAPMERLKPPVSSINLTNPIRKLSGTHTNCSNSNNRTLLSSGGGAKSPSNPLHLADSNNAPSKLKRTSPGEAAAGSAQKDIQSPEVKKKIQHVTWP